MEVLYDMFTLIIFSVACQLIAVPIFYRMRPRHGGGTAGPTEDGAR
jgi:hypothetical protein